MDNIFFSNQIFFFFRIGTGRIFFDNWSVAKFSPNDWRNNGNTHPRAFSAHGKLDRLKQPAVLSDRC